MGDKKTNYVFQRIEKKYLVDESIYKLIQESIKPYMIIDEHGISTICNIYYDTDAYDLIRNSIEKPNYKEKLRLRSYGIPKGNDTVYLEIKKKFKDTVYKRRVSMSLKESENYLEHGIKPKCNGQILKEIDYFIDFYGPKKKLYIAYDRIAFFSKEDENLRITFDCNIRSRTYDLDLKNGAYGNELLESKKYLMEIKTSAALPIWLASLLSDLKIYPNSFSKYGNIYKQDLVNHHMSDKSIKKELLINVISLGGI